MLFSKKISIFIPTYDRNTTLLESLSVLMPVIPTDIEIVVIDNCSTVTVENTLSQNNFEYKNLRVIRNATNVGLSGNIIKCFENCQTDWLWILSDDDKIKENAFEIINFYINNHSKVAYINFTSDLVNRQKKNVRSQDTLINGADSFFEKIDDFSNIVFLSVGIYQMQYFKQNIRFAYLFGYTLCPHTAILLASMKEDTQVILSHREVVERYVISGVDKENTWSQLFIRLSVPALYEIPITLSKKNKYKWNRIIHDSIGRPLRVLSEIIMYLDKKDINELKFLYNQICHRVIPFGVSLFWRIEFLICKIILLINPLARLFENMNRALRNKKGKVVTNVDMFNRI